MKLFGGGSLVIKKSDRAFMLSLLLLSKAASCDTRGACELVLLECLHDISDTFEFHRFRWAPGAVTDVIPGANSEGTFSFIINGILEGVGARVETTDTSLLTRTDSFEKYLISAGRGASDLTEVCIATGEMYQFLRLA